MRFDNAGPVWGTAHDIAGDPLWPTAPGMTARPRRGAGLRTRASSAGHPVVGPAAGSATDGPTARSSAMPPSGAHPVAGDPAGLDRGVDLPGSLRPPAGDRARRARPQAVPLPPRGGPARRRQVRSPDRVRARPARDPRRVHADLRRPGLPREKVLATIVRLLEMTLIRVGNDEYARMNRSFGLTTLEDRHATVTGTRSGSGSAASPASSTRSGCETRVLPRRPALPGPAWPGAVPVRRRGRRARRCRTRTTSTLTCARSRQRRSRPRTSGRGPAPCGLRALRALVPGPRDRVAASR